MKKLLIGLVALAVVGGWLFSRYWYYLPGIVSDIVDPVGGQPSGDLADGSRRSLTASPGRPTSC